MQKRHNTCVLALESHRCVIFWTNDGLVYLCIYASLGLNELNRALAHQHASYLCLITPLNPWWELIYSVIPTSFSQGAPTLTAAVDDDDASTLSHVLLSGESFSAAAGMWEAGRDLTLLILEMKYSRFGAQYHACSVFTLLYNQWGGPPHNFCWPPHWILSKLPPHCYLYPTDGKIIFTTKIYTIFWL